MNAIQLTQCGGWFHILWEHLGSKVKQPLSVTLGNEAVFNRFKGFSIPYTLVLDGQQKIVNIYRGPTTKESLEEDLEKINQGK